MFRFTIRDVLWLTVLVALAAGWWVDRGRLAARISKQAYDNYTLRMAVATREDILNALDKDWKEYLRRW